jgi:hypothetical protein
MKKKAFSGLQNMKLAPMIPFNCLHKPKELILESLIEAPSRLKFKTRQRG